MKKLDVKDNEIIEDFKPHDEQDLLIAQVIRLICNKTSDLLKILIEYDISPSACID